MYRVYIGGHQVFSVCTIITMHVAAWLQPLMFCLYSSKSAKLHLMDMLMNMFILTAGTLLSLLLVDYYIYYYSIATVVYIQYM